MEDQDARSAWVFGVDIQPAFQLFGVYLEVCKHLKQVEMVEIQRHVTIVTVPSSTVCNVTVDCRLDEIVSHIIMLEVPLQRHVVNIFSSLMSWTDK